MIAGSGALAAGDELTEVIYDKDRGIQKRAARQSSDPGGDRRDVSRFAHGRGGH